MRSRFPPASVIKSENTTFNFGVNLDPPSNGALTIAEAIAFVTGPLFDYSDWFSNQLVASDGASGSSDRRDKVNPLLLAEPLF